jgi:hypothetical protein
MYILRHPSSRFFPASSKCSRSSVQLANSCGLNMGWTPGGASKRTTLAVLHPMGMFLLFGSAVVKPGLVLLSASMYCR